MFDVLIFKITEFFRKLCNHVISNFANYCIILQHFILNNIKYIYIYIYIYIYYTRDIAICFKNVKL